MKTALLVLLCCLPAWPLLAWNPTASPQPQGQNPPSSDAAEFRQFDFWLGDWDVQTLDGQPAGRNTISKEYRGFVLREQWVGSGGGVGTSLNIYDRTTGQWHQTWVDSSGTLLQLDGGLDEDGVMVMRGTRPAPNQQTARHEVRWKPLEKGRVRQTWRTSTDDGASWSTLADLVYVPRESSAKSEKKE